LTANSATVLVTGASQGIGRAISLELARRSHPVLGVSRSKPEELHAANDSETAARLAWKSLDLSNATKVGAFVSSLRSLPIRMLVLSAVDYGVDGRHPASAISPEEWQRVVSTNCIGQCVLLSRLLPKLVANSPGVIVNISSDVAIFPGPGRAAYAASKAGLHATLRAVVEEHPFEELRVYQLIPTFQLATAGIRRRRPPGHDFSSYGDPAIIARVVSQLAEGKSIPAGAYLVKPDGTIEEYRERTEFSHR
jgi:NAD(P)-dependent dehydrogenase (short-subunit alcohol dehydrogenase family)